MNMKDELKIVPYSKITYTICGGDFTMKAAIYKGIKQVDLVEIPTPDCDDNGIVIKNICASIDLLFFRFML